MRRIAVVNQKGGTGKTVTTVNLGASLARLGKRVLLLDLDPQGNLSLHLGLADGSPNMTDLLLNGKVASDVVKRTTVEGLDAIPAGIDLTNAEIQLVPELGREVRLTNKIGTDLDERYDYCLVDCPPSLGLLTVNALRFASEVLVPINCEYFALQGVALLTRTIGAIQAQLAHTIKVGGILLTFFDPRRITCQKADERVKEAFGDLVFQTKIRSNVALAHATEAMVDVGSFDPQCAGSDDYKALAEEVVHRGS